jgi:hypothetical protein
MEPPFQCFVSVWDVQTLQLVHTLSLGALAIILLQSNRICLYLHLHVLIRREGANISPRVHRVASTRRFLVTDSAKV